MTISSRPGALCLVLHGHMPYVLQSGRRPCGEERIYEAMAETYAPLAQMLENLAAEGISSGLTLSFTPILLEQLADAHIQKSFVDYLDERIRRARDDRARFAREKNSRLKKLAEEHLDRFQKIRAYFTEVCGVNLPARFRALQDAGHIEILASAATHAYLPLLGRDSSVHAQLEAGLRATRHHFGRTPTGFWLPECGYRPAQPVEMTRTESYHRPAVDEFLSSLGANYFVADSHALSGPESAHERTGCRPFLTRAGVSVFGRHRHACEKVWSEQEQTGYPLAPEYRDYLRRDIVSGLSYLCASDPERRNLSEQDIYQPEAARTRTAAQADDFANAVENELTRFQKESHARGVVAAAFKMELFGHRWHEGFLWLENVLRRIQRDRVVEVMPLGHYLRLEPSVEAVEIPESSWGRGGGHETWDNADTQSLWTEIHAAELAMENLVESISQTDDLEMRYLRQAGRELLLLQASDWPYMISTGEAREYAEERYRAHLERFRKLARILKDGSAASADALEELSSYESQDNCFQRLDPHLFARRQPQPIRNLVPKFVGIA